MRGWVSDLALGVRLAVGGGRTSLARFVLSAIGIAIAVTVLLVGASVGNMVAQHQQRSSADAVTTDAKIPGVDPVYYKQNPTEFRGESIDVAYVYADGDNPPVPAGMTALPGPGEVVVSPELAELLRSPDGELLRPRFPADIVGVMGQEMVAEPGDLSVFVGMDASFADVQDAFPVYRFGGSGEDRSLPADVLLVVLIGAVVLLLPVFIFVSSASRIAGAERDRRLSALRLVGSGSRQVRRIAAAESLVSAVAGLVLGAAVFLLLRQYAEHVELFGLRVYRSDVVPDPVQVVLIVLAIPALAVLTALFALRRTIIEPLGVVRQVKPVRRRVWWRLLLIVAGVALLFTGGGASEASDTWAVAVSAGAALLLIGVPVLLPWLVERVAGRIEGGPSSWQLAIRRLQLDSGTSARVVGGVAVVLAGAIALQTVLMTVEAEVGLPGTALGERPTVEASTDSSIVDEVAADLGTVAAVRDTHVVRFATGYVPGAAPDSGNNQYLSIMDCPALRDLAGVSDCADGQAFTVSDRGPVVKPGDKLEFRQFKTADPDMSDYDVVATWTAPTRLRSFDLAEHSRIYSTLVLTPAALGDLTLPGDYASVLASVDDDISADDMERVRNAVAAFGPSVYVYSYSTNEDLTASQRTFVSVRNGLYVGSIFTLMLAGVSLLVLALEHIRERRRPLAVLAASGVQRGVLARSLLWQVALPIALGVAVAVLTGVGLASLIVRLAEQTLAIDWVGVGLLAAGAALLSVLVTAMTLPFLRSATRLTSLRTE
ncbi:FtsX-like permease family protein [Actinophytocola sp.]|uniref:FtsX-like permease family protein n=1 Tax=Actinophytocola sp. TaxID=1872138 RepID=UPI0025B998BF|nr:FtsX-like permease family protein [Actinophytocola sp.]